MPVSRYYCGGGNNSLRAPQMGQFGEELLSGDTLSVGVDWYGLMGISNRFIPRELLSTEFVGLVGGEVVVYNVYWVDGGVRWEKTR